MELSSSVTLTWKFCTIVSLLGCLILVIFLHKNDQILVTTTISAVLELAPAAQPETLSTIVTPSKIKADNVSIFSNFSRSSVVDETPPSSFNFTFVKSKDKEKTTKQVRKRCNMFEGRWVYKPEANPIYNVTSCPFIEEKMSCQRNERPDFEYEKWSWEARDCEIPLLNGRDMVEKFRNKRVILVGDSLNRNMWESLACILYSSIPNPSSIAHIRSDGKMIRTMLEAKEEYNLTVEFFWSPFLVELKKKHESGKKVLILDELSPNSELWAGADIMVFNSGHWWTQLGKKKAWELFEYKGKLIKDMPLHIAYKRGMKTWAKWIQKNVDPKKTSLFFRGVSAEHLDKQRNQWCYTKTKPIMDESYKPFFPRSLIKSIEGVIKGMGESRVKYLNITKLSEYRIDAHPSIYRYKDWKIRANTDISNLTSTADCGHWCLPGLPDTWNRLLYASLYFDTLADVSNN
ncbi:unnamed protein product [Amaranthus hypochondriacus]